MIEDVITVVQQQRAFMNDQQRQVDAMRCLLGLLDSTLQHLNSQANAMADVIMELQQQLRENGLTPCR